MKIIFIWLEDNPYYEEVGEINIKGMEEDFKPRKKPKRKSKGFKELVK